MPKPYRLTAPDGYTYESDSRELGGKIYDRLDCRSANLALPKGYAKHRVFFEDEVSAIAAGYRPCGTCMRPRHQIWKAAGEPGTEADPGRVLPKELRLHRKNLKSIDRGKGFPELSP